MRKSLIRRRRNKKYSCSCREAPSFDFTQDGELVEPCGLPKFGRGPLTAGFRKLNKPLPYEKKKFTLRW
jgi:hypothetical protein